MGGIIGEDDVILCVCRSAVVIERVMEKREGKGERRVTYTQDTHTHTHAVRQTMNDVVVDINS